MLSVKKFYIVILFYCLQQHAVSLEKGDYCTLNSGESGICELLVQCPAALQALQKHVFPTNCGGFAGTIPIVCCKNDNAKPPPSPTPTTATTTTTQRINTQPTPPRRTETTTEKATFVNPPGVGHKARAKCWQYREYVYEWMYPAVLLPGAEKIRKDTCGQVAVKLIVGGTEASSREFPHMALLGYDVQGTIEWKCGGSLISEQYILTAAHCGSARDLGNVVRVRLGDLDVASETDDARPQEIPVADGGIIRHPKYTSLSKYNDIALLKLKYAATFNGYVRPACLYTTFDTTTSKAIATGWGKTEYAGSESNHLLKVVLEFFTNPMCNESYQDNDRLQNGIVKTQLCAGTFGEEAKDTCQGDSGGPLQVFNPNVYCMYDIVGVTSFGKACGFNIPGVYTRIFEYLEWIENIVWP